MDYGIYHASMASRGKNVWKQCMTNFLRVSNGSLNIQAVATNMEHQKRLRTITSPYFYRTVYDLLTYSSMDKHILTTENHNRHKQTLSHGLIRQDVKWQELNVTVIQDLKKCSAET